MRFSRTTVYALAAVLIVGGIGAGLATGAPKKKAKTKVTIKFQDTDYSDSFTGNVKAKAKGKGKKKLKRKCKKKRTVSLVRKGAGKVGTDRTDKKGRWGIPVGGSADPGQYIAKVKKKKAGKKGVCKKGKSKTVTVS
jgi:hypothetical protein